MKKKNTRQNARINKRWRKSRGKKLQEIAGK